MSKTLHERWLASDAFRAAYSAAYSAADDPDVAVYIAARDKWMAEHEEEEAER